MSADSLLSLFVAIAQNQGQVQTASVGIPVGTTLFIGIIMIGVNWFAIRAANKRYFEDHLTREKEVMESFKIHVATSLEKIEGNIKTSVESIDGSKVGWEHMEDHRKENSTAISRVHEKIEKSTKVFNDCLNGIKESVGEIGKTAAELRGGFKEHIRAAHS